MAFIYKCAECGTRSIKKTYVLASRLVGGNYRQGPRHGRSTICTDCGQEIVDYYTRGVAFGRGIATYTGSCRWDVRSVIRAMSEKRGCLVTAPHFIDYGTGI